MAVVLYASAGNCSSRSLCRSSAETEDEAERLPLAPSLSWPAMTAQGRGAPRSSTQYSSVPSGRTPSPLFHATSSLRRIMRAVCTTYSFHAHVPSMTMSRLARTALSSASSATFTLYPCTYTARSGSSSRRPAYTGSVALKWSLSMYTASPCTPNSPVRSERRCDSTVDLPADMPPPRNTTMGLRRRRCGCRWPAGEDDGGCREGEEAEEEECLRAK